MKPFKGVLTDWEFRDQRIHGTVLHHDDAVELNEAVLRGFAIVEEHPVTTSPVVGMVRKGRVVIAETKNRRYILIDHLCRDVA